MADPFISRQDLTDYLGRDLTADDGALICVDAACDICRDISEQTFNAGTSTVALDGSNTDALRLPEMPVNSAGTVVVRDSRGATTTLGSADYTVGDLGVLYATNTAGTSLIGTTWPTGRQNIEVTYDHGFSDDDMPRSVRMVALGIAARALIQGPTKMETIGQNQIQYSINAGDLTEGEKAVLRKYRRT